jgi:hypothetical protein
MLQINFFKNVPHKLPSCSWILLGQWGKKVMIPGQTIKFLKITNKNYEQYKSLYFRRQMTICQPSYGKVIAKLVYLIL